MIEFCSYMRSLRFTFIVALIAILLVSAGKAAPEAFPSEGGVVVLDEVSFLKATANVARVNGGDPTVWVVCFYTRWSKFSVVLLPQLSV